MQGLFSATLTSDVKQLIKAGLRQPVTVAIKKPGQASGTIAMPSSLHCYYLVKLCCDDVIINFGACTSICIMPLCVCRNVQLNRD